jgi:hypothetical protein
MLREFEELSYAEIAELLKLPLNTVRTRNAWESLLRIILFCAEAGPTLMLWQPFSFFQEGCFGGDTRRLMQEVV